MTSLGIAALSFSVLLCLLGCQGQTVIAHGPLKHYSSSWLVLPGSPARYLEKQLGRKIPKAPSKADKQLFEHYDAEGPSLWAANWTRELDFSGVAWDHAKAGALIHPQFVVFASHFPRRLGEELVFHDRRGLPVKRRIASKRVIYRVREPDVTVARLDQPVPDSIAHYPLLSTERDYQRVLVGAPLLVTDKERQIHVFRINRVSKNRFGEIGARPGIGRDRMATWQERLEKGDSGHPAFILLREQLILVSTLKGGGWASKGPFFGNKRLQAAVIAAMKALEPADKRP